VYVFGSPDDAEAAREQASRPIRVAGANDVFCMMKFLG
jgi:hypothetical protein